MKVRIKQNERVRKRGKDLLPTTNKVENEP